MDAAVSLVASSGNVLATSVAAAVLSARSWRRSALGTAPSRGSAPVAHPQPISDVAVAALTPRTALVAPLAAFPLGAATLYTGPVRRVWRDNHPSAYSLSSVVDEHIAARVASGRLLDVTPLYVADPLLPAIVAPLAVVPKSTPGTYRLILDGSSGVGLCVNDSIDPASLGSFPLATGADICSAILRARAERPDENVLIWVSDFKDAYLNVPVRVDDYWQLATVWRNRVYWNTVAPFGLRSSDRLLAQLTHAIADTVTPVSGIPCHIYVDDAAAVGFADTLSVHRDLFTRTAASVGQIVHPVKSLDPATRRRFIGWDFDSVALTMSLPPDRAAKLLATLSRFADARRVRKRDLQSILGAMNSAQQGIRHARAFMAECFSCLASASSPSHWVTLTPLARLDLQWWRDLLLTYNGVSFFRPPVSHVTGFSDASNTGWDGHGGYGWLCPELRIYSRGPWPAELSGTHINALELLSALSFAYALSHLAITSPGTAVHALCRSDNTSAVSAITRGRSRAGDLARLTRALHFLLATSPALHALSSSFVQGICNPDADALSRGRLPPCVAGWTYVPTPTAWLVSMLRSERPWLAAARSPATLPAAPPS